MRNFGKGNRYTPKKAKKRKFAGLTKPNKLLKQLIPCEKKIRITKKPRYGCSVARRLCIKCLSYIHKLDSNYELKICKACAKTDEPTALAHVY